MSLSTVVPCKKSSVGESYFNFQSGRIFISRQNCCVSLKAYKTWKGRITQSSYRLSLSTIQVIEEIEIEINNNFCTITNLKFLYNLNIFDSNYVVRYRNNEFLIKKNNLVSYTVIQ